MIENPTPHASSIDWTRVGESVGLIVIGAITALGGIARRYINALKKLEEATSEPDDTHAGASSEMHMRPATAAGIHQHVANTKAELLDEIERMREGVSRLEADLRVHTNETTQKLERLRVVEVKVERVEADVRDARAERIRDREEILQAFAEVRRSLDNLHAVTVRKWGSREGDPMGRERGAPENLG